MRCFLKEARSIGKLILAYPTLDERLEASPVAE